MKKLIASILFLASLLFPVSNHAQGIVRIPGPGGLPPASSSITVVQEQKANTSSSCNSVTTCSITITSSVGAGHLLVYFTAVELGSGLNACTDTTGGSSQNTIATALNVNLASGSQRISYVANSNAGSTVVTCTTTSAANIHMHVWEVSGTTTGTPLDLHESHTQTGTAQSYTSTGSTSFANEILFGFFYDRTNDDSWTAGSGFSPSLFSDGGSGNESALSESKIISSTGTQTITATCGASVLAAQLLVTFH